MRFTPLFLTIGLLLACPNGAWAKAAVTETQSAPQQLEVSADNSLEWYEGQSVYVARGNAKAVQGDLTVTGDLLTAHKRDKAAAKSKDKKTDDKKAEGGSGDIDQMTAEGNVVILKGTARITGDRAVNDVDQQVIVVTGNNLRYESDQQIVTARDSLEYWTGRKMAVARGKAVATKEDRRVEADVLTAEFRDQPNGSQQLYKMTAIGNVIVATGNDLTRGDRAVYDAARNIAIVSGHVRITRQDGTQLSGDVGESDFTAKQSRLLNDGTGRVRALLPAKSTPAKSEGKKQ